MAEKSLVKPHVQIRTCRPADHDNLQILWKELLVFHEKLDPERHVPTKESHESWMRYLRQCLNAEGVQFQVAELDGKLVGFVSYRALTDPAIIENIFVQPEARGKGVGEMLIGSAELSVKAQRGQRILIQCEPNNTTALKFYESHGYSKSRIHLIKNLSTPVGQAVADISEGVHLAELEGPPEVGSARVLAKAPWGWYLSGRAPDDYECVIDNSVSHSGSRCACIKHIVPNPRMCTLMQEFASSKHLGKRLQMTMWTKTDDVDGFVAPWMRVDGAGGSGKPLCFDNMCERRVKGTTGWTKHQIVLDVPNDSVNIAFGVILSGKGKVWIDDIAFEEVGANVAATDCPCSRRSRAVPRNLNFEKDQEG